MVPSKETCLNPWNQIAYMSLYKGNVVLGYSTSVIQCRIDGTADAWCKPKQVDCTIMSGKKKLEDFVG